MGGAKSGNFRKEPVDKFRFIMEKMIITYEKLIKKSVEQQNWNRASSLESYKSGLEQALANYEVTRP